MDSTSLQPVRAQFEAMLLEPLFQPLEEAFGGYGTVAVQSFTEALAKAMTPQ